ncbi:peptidyl-prolyl cis-trans isomerase-like 4 [Holotrichia oblita]|uniref:Peptidyl-prolyl cis-trans isomerase-like 4 n=1 Tax=Holotrichia oblita TaxID=644536 RepID=A0ACB9SR52_HOLOL|nr:peptidyl-prolyl cis-trans isomerase-like 4 [Holotrichia oblita]
MGLVSFVGTEDHMIGSQFFITLGTELTYLDEQHCVFGEVMEGLDVLELLNEVICDQDNRPYQDVRITHTVVLDDPFPDPEYLRVPPRSPSPNAERLQGGRIAPDEEIDESQGKSLEEVNEIVAFKEAKARARAILEMIGDIPDAEMAPPENVLFVCKLNPVTTDDDLEIIFSRFGKINSCEVIRDKKTDESLQYAFVEFDDRKACEDAYFKMDNVLIDDRRIHVDFSQSVAKVKWHGKGRGVTTYNDKGKKIADSKNDIGNGRYKRAPNNSDKQENYQRNRYVEDKKYSREDRGDYRNHSRHRSYDRREQFNEYKKYDTGQTYSRKYDKYKSGIRQDERSKERDDYNKTRYSSRSFEKFDKKDTKGLSQRSRSHSYDKYKDKKEDYTRSKREKYEPKKAKSSHSKHSKQKKKRCKSSSESSSMEDESDSSSEALVSKKKHKEKRSESPAMEERKSRKIKKKNKSKKKKYSDSSEES